MRMIIDDIAYNIKDDWKLRLRHPKTLGFALVIATLLLTLGLAHADPTLWPLWAGGGGGRAVRW